MRKLYQYFEDQHIIFILIVDLECTFSLDPQICAFDLQFYILTPKLVKVAFSFCINETGKPGNGLTADHLVR